MRTSAFSSFGVALLAALAVTAACASQGEGERCDRTNGNDDCESGLRCTPQSSINGQDTRASICCPDGRAATVDACRTVVVRGSGGSSNASGGAASGGGGTDGSVASGGAGGSGGSTDGAVSSGGTSSDASPGVRPDGAIDGAP